MRRSSQCHSCVTKAGGLSRLPVLPSGSESSTANERVWESTQQQLNNTDTGMQDGVLLRCDIVDTANAAARCVRLVTIDLKQDMLPFLRCPQL